MVTRWCWGRVPVCPIPNLICFLPPWGIPFPCPHSHFWTRPCKARCLPVGKLQGCAIWAWRRYLGTGQGFETGWGRPPLLPLLTLFQSHSGAVCVLLRAGTSEPNRLCHNPRLPLTSSVPWATGEFLSHFPIYKMGIIKHLSQGSSCGQSQHMLSTQNSCKHVVRAIKVSALRVITHQHPAWIQEFMREFQYDSSYSPPICSSYNILS